jgi:hypothetical protein
MTKSCKFAAQPKERHADLGTSMAFYKSSPGMIKQAQKNNRRNP